MWAWAAQGREKARRKETQVEPGSYQAVPKAADSVAQASEGQQKETREVAPVEVGTLSSSPFFLSHMCFRLRFWNLPPFVAVFLSLMC